MTCYATEIEQFFQMPGMDRIFLENFAMAKI